MTKSKPLYDRSYYEVDWRQPRQREENFDRQRFENYTAWYDVQQRAQQKSNEHYLGLTPTTTLYGFEPRRAPKQQTRFPKPFLVQEPSFTSGTVCRRKYDENFGLEDIKFDGGRTDPFHEPNILGVKRTDHWKDYRSGNRHPDIERLPHLWRKMDHELKAAIPDSEVRAYVNSKQGVVAKNDPNDPTFKVLFIPDNKIRPPPETVQRLENKKVPSPKDLDEARGPPSPRQKMLAKRKAEMKFDQTMSEPTKLETVKPNEWKTFAKVNPRARDIFRQSSLLLRCQQGKPSVPKKVFVPPSIDYSSLESDRIKLKYPGGRDAVEGNAGTWSVEHESCPGLGQFATPPMPITSTVWDYV